MNVTYRTTTAVIAASIAATCSANEIIGSADVYLGGGIDMVFDTLPDVSIGMLIDGDTSPQNQLFFAEHISISTGDVGTTWVSDAQTTDLIRQQFQDGDADDAFGVYSLLPTDIGTQEAFAGIQEWQFEFQFPPLDASDLATGMDEIWVTLVSFSADSPGFDPNGDGIWTDYLAVYRFDFVSVPSPASSVALLMGGVVVARRRRPVA